MKRTKSITAPLIVSTAAALVLAGCSHGYQSRRCIDNVGRVLPDSYCQGYSSMPYGYIGSPHWGYGGSGYYSGGHYYMHNYSSSGGSYGGGSGSTSRGGFGGAGGGHGGGGGS